MSGGKLIGALYLGHNDVRVVRGPIVAAAVPEVTIAENQQLLDQSDTVFLCLMASVAREILPNGRMSDVIIRDARAKPVSTYTAKRGIITRSETSARLTLEDGMFQKIENAKTNVGKGWGDKKKGTCCGAFVFKFDCK